MKKTFYLLLTGLALSNAPIHAQVDFDDIGSTNVKPVANESAEEPGPFKIDLAGDWVSKAKVKHCAGGKVQYAYGQAECNFVFHYDRCYKEGLALAALYERTQLDWDNNPFFSQTGYNTASVLLSGFTERFTDWVWRGQVAANFDNLEYWNFSDYMDYDMLLWGRYAYRENIGLHIGFLAQTGMKLDRVYPIVGVDWQYNCHWAFNLIFPLNISAVYKFNRTWAVSLAGRFLDQRHRTRADDEDLFSKAVWHYQTGGAELALTYTPSVAITANIHAGYNFGGHLTIGDRHYNHRRRLDVESAPYAGAEVAFNF